MSSATTTYAERVASCRPPTPLLRSPPPAGNALPRPPVRRLLDFSAGGGLDHEDDDEFLCRAGEIERSHQEAKCRTAQGPAPPAFREKQCICARGPCDVVWEERGGRRGWAYVCSAPPRCIHFAWCEESDHNPNSQPSFRSHPEPIHPRAFNTPSNHRAGASTPQGADATTPINVSPQGARSNDSPICKCRAGKCKKLEIKGVYYYICPIPKGQGACPYRVRVDVVAEELVQTGKNNPKENNHLEYNPVKKKANEHNLVNIAENNENGPVNLDQPEDGEGPSGIVDDKIVPNDRLALAPFAVVAHAQESPSMLHQPIAMVELETPTKSPMPPTGTISPITPRSNCCFRCGEEGHWSTNCPKPPLPCYRCGEMACSMLCAVSQDVQHWRVKVRITRLWETQDRKDNTSMLRKYFIMIDEQGNKMEAYIPETLVNRFTDNIIEDHVYCIEYFEVRKAKEQYRAVDNDLQARFTRWTKVREILPVPRDFPLFAYKLQTFQQILSRIDDNTCLADIIGVVTFIGDVAMVNSKGQLKARRHITLNDRRDEATLALWENTARDFDAERLYNISKQEPVVAIFAGCTFKLHEGKLSLSASYACKQYINIPNPDIASFQNSLAGAPYEIKWKSTGTTAQQQNDPIETTVSELSLQNPYDIMNRRYICRATIKGLAPHDKWWYLACRSCKRTSVPHGDSYKCTNCPSIVAEPRYKLAVEAIDDLSDSEEIDNSSDNTPVIELIFFGDTAQELIGQPAILLLSAEHDTADAIPKEITALFGRTYVFEAIVSRGRGSFQRENISFQVNRIHPQPTSLLRSAHPNSTLEAGTSSSQVFKQRCPIQQTQQDTTITKHQDQQITQEPQLQTTKQAYDSTLTPSHSSLLQQPEKAISKLTSMEHFMSTRSQTTEKSLPLQDATPPETTDTPLQLSSKRRNTSTGTSKTARKLFKDNDGKPISKT